MTVISTIINFLRGRKKCGLCKETFKAYKPNKIFLSSSDKEPEEIVVCQTCSDILEVIKTRHEKVSEKQP